MKLMVKICGMRDPANILEVAAIKPDYMGFIYYEGSPRFVGHNFQAPALDKRIKRVGVFVNQSKEFVLGEVERSKLEAVQLHGNESPDFCFGLKAEGLEVIKAFSIDSDFDFLKTNTFQFAADYFLFDTKGKNYGGTGMTFDWTLLKQYTGSTSFFLSGGLSEQNIAQVLSIQHPALFAIDLNSGVEDAPGFKNIQKINSLAKLLNEL